MECAAKGLAGEPCARDVVYRRCGGCGAVAYCSRSHQVLHWSIHKSECARLEKQMSSTDMLSQFPFTFSVELPAQNTSPTARCKFLESIKLHRKGLWKLECMCGPSVASASDLRITDEWNLESSLCPCTEPENPMSRPLTGWEDYYQWRSLPLHSPVAILLHSLYTLDLLERMIEQDNKEVVMAIRSASFPVYSRINLHDGGNQGPEKEFLQLAVFGELLALFPGVKLYIELVGPAVPEFRDGEVVSISNYAHCSDQSCRCKSYICSEDLSCSTVTLKLWKGFYHDKYSDIVKDSNPHLIVAPNAGVAAYPSWVPTIELIREIGVPAIFTDYCEEAAHLASCCLSSITGQPLRLPIQGNPFRQPMVVDNSALCLPCYSNCFVFGI